MILFWHSSVDVNKIRLFRNFQLMLRLLVCELCMFIIIMIICIAQASVKKWPLAATVFCCNGHSLRCFAVLNCCIGHYAGNYYVNIINRQFGWLFRQTMIEFARNSLHTNIMYLCFYWCENFNFFGENSGMRLWIMKWTFKGIIKFYKFQGLFDGWFWLKDKCKHCELCTSWF